VNTEGRTLCCSNDTRSDEHIMSFQETRVLVSARSRAVTEVARALKPEGADAKKAARRTNKHVKCAKCFFNVTAAEEGKR